MDNQQQSSETRAPIKTPLDRALTRKIGESYWSGFYGLHRRIRDEEKSSREQMGGALTAAVRFLALIIVSASGGQTSRSERLMRLTVEDLEKAVALDLAKHRANAKVGQKKTEEKKED